MAQNYVNNAEFLRLLEAYIEERESAEREGRPPPRVSDKIGKIFIDIATNLSNRYNFNGYTYKEEMIGDGILNAIEAINCFNPAKSKNPFAYFTQIIYWAFIRRIEKEKKQRKTRDELMFDVSSETATMGADGKHYDVGLDNTYLWYNNQ